MIKDVRKNIEWRDLVGFTPCESRKELLISLPWLIASLVFASLGWSIAALAMSFMFFMTGLRQVHDVFHRALGLPRWANYLTLYTLSCLMLGSMHSVKVNHLRHHQFCLEEEDIEGRYALLKWWQVIFFYGPIYPIIHHYNALKVATRKDRYWILLELLSNAGILIGVFYYFRNEVLIYHYVAMIIAQMFSVFFAVWAVHHGAEDHPFQARTIRHAFKGNITYQLFYHAEHHLFPAVPTKRLPELAKRIDAYLPDLKKQMVY